MHASSLRHRILHSPWLLKFSHWQSQLLQIRPHLLWSTLCVFLNQSTMKNELSFEFKCWYGHAVSKDLFDLPSVFGCQETISENGFIVPNTGCSWFKVNSGCMVDKEFSSVYHFIRENSLWLKKKALAQHIKTLQFGRSALLSEPFSSGHNCVFAT